MTNPVFSVQGDTLDLLIHRTLGTTAGTVEETLDSNTGLAAKGVVLPLRTEVVPPDAPDPTPTINLVSIWD